MQRPLGVIFDLGGTVLQIEPAGLIAGNARLLKFANDNLGLSAEDIQKVADKIALELENVKDESMIEFPVQSFHRVLFETLGISFTISYPEMEKEFWHAAVNYKPTDGIFDILDVLEANQVKAGILCNTSFSGVVLEDELAKHNLVRRFSFVLSSADYGFRKPHNRFFQIAIKKMDLQPGDIWFIGDKLEYDIRGAIDSGLYPIWYNPQNKQGNPDYPCLEIKS